MVYSGIKAGVMGITRAAAAELGGRDIRVNAIAPSAVPTEGTQRNRNAERDATASPARRWAGSAPRRTSPAPSASSPPTKRAS